MKIEILCPGCSHCEKLVKNVEKAVKEQNIGGCEIEKVTDLKKILGYGVMMTPGLVIDGKVKSVGKVLSSDDIKKLLSK
jgi:small redox-active disulfide protein 2